MSAHRVLGMADRMRRRERMLAAARCEFCEQYPELDGPGRDAEFVIHHHPGCPNFNPEEEA